MNQMSRFFIPFVLPLLIQLSAGASNSWQANVYQVKAAKEAEDRDWQILFTNAREYDNPPATLLKAIERIRPTGETVTFSFLNPMQSVVLQLVRLQWQNQGRGELTGTLFDPTGTQHTISKVMPMVFPIPALQLVTSKSLQVIPSDSIIRGIKVSPYVDISTFVENERDEREKEHKRALGEMRFGEVMDRKSLQESEEEERRDLQILNEIQEQIWGHIWSDQVTERTKVQREAEQIWKRFDFRTKWIAMRKETRDEQWKKMFEDLKDPRTLHGESGSDKCGFVNLISEIHSIQDAFVFHRSVRFGLRPLLGGGIKYVYLEWNHGDLNGFMFRSHGDEEQIMWVKPGPMRLMMSMKVDGQKISSFTIDEENYKIIDIKTKAVLTDRNDADERMSVIPRNGPYECLLEKSSAQQMMRNEELSDRQLMRDNEDRNRMQMMEVVDEGLNVKCPICWERKKLDGTMVKAPCGICVDKWYCRACLNRWRELFAYGQIVLCPTCRQTLH